MKLLIKAFALSVILCAMGMTHAATITVFNTVMTGDQANAGQGTGSDGKGAGTMTLDHDTGLFSWFIAWENLDAPVTNAHFHGPANPDENGGVQVPIDFNVNPTSGSATLTNTQIDQLLAGLWYINIHSAAHPGGEIRGQVLALTAVPIPAAVWLFGAALVSLSGFSRRRS